MRKEMVTAFRRAAFGISILITYLAAHIWNDPWDSTGIGIFYNMIFMFLFIFLMAMMNTDASDKRRNINAILLLLISSGALLFALAKQW
jgi:uncharacterized protein YacL